MRRSKDNCASLKTEVFRGSHLFLLNEYKFAIKNIWYAELNDFYDICCEFGKNNVGAPTRAVSVQRAAGHLHYKRLIG